MLATPPKLRTDLVVSSQKSAEGTTFILKDPVAGGFFRLGEPQYFIARQLDGATSLETVQQRVLEKFGVALEAAELEKFQRQLDRLGLLEPETRDSSPSASRGRVRGSLLYLRFKAFDPDRLLSRLVGKIWFFFTPYFVALSAVSIVSAFLISVFNWSEIVAGFWSLWRFDALLLAWFTVILATALHEFAHGFTCKHFGGEVHEMGFMLIYFNPAFYCNVSDAWLFPEKSKRLWVTFAGGYFEIFLWSVATLIWRFVEPGTWLSFFALVVMATSGIKTFFNLNPLIKLDGYYLLSDYLEIPNLRYKSVGFISAQAKRLWGAGRHFRTAEISSREKGIYIVYGLLAGFDSYWILGYIATRLGGFFVERYQGLGLLLCIFLVAGIFPNSVGKPLRALPHRLKTLLERVLPGRRTTKACILLGVAAAVLFLVPLELKVPGEVDILPVHNADVRAEIEGIVEEIQVQEGDVVKKGDLIGRLSSRGKRAELQKIEAEIDELQARLRMLKAGPRREEIELARREVATARTRFQQALNAYAEAEKTALNAS